MSNHRSHHVEIDRRWWSKWIGSTLTTSIDEYRQISVLWLFTLSWFVGTLPHCCGMMLFDKIGVKIAPQWSYVERFCSSCIWSNSNVFGTGIKVPCREQQSQGASQVLPGHSCLGHFFSISSIAWCITSFASSSPCRIFRFGELSVFLNINASRKV